MSDDQPTRQADEIAPETTLRWAGALAAYRRWRFPALATVVIGGATLAFETSTWGDRLETLTARRFEFAVRGALRTPPAPNPRLKVLVLDDAAVAKLGGPEPGFELWGDVLAAVAARQPRVVLIDKLFGRDRRDVGSESLVTRLKELQAPVYVGAYCSRAPITGRDELDAAALPAASAVSPDAPRSWARWPLSGGCHFYGPAPELLPAFAGVGQILHLGYGTVAPFLALKDGRLAPHLSLLSAAGGVTPAEEGPLLHGRVIPLDRKGRIAANLWTTDHYFRRTIGMKGVFTYVQKSKPLTFIDPGDVVLILPAMYTGHTDWAETPVGSVPGGLILMALIDSVLGGRWLTPLGGLEALILMGAVLGARLGRVRRTPWFWSVLLGAAGVAVTTSLGLFAFVGWIVPWLFPLGCFLATAIVVQLDTARGETKERIRLDHEMATARAVQRFFLPSGDDAAAPSARAAVTGRYVPASECSGDWWGRVPAPDNGTYVLIGDAMGHGASAALLTAAIATACGAYARAVAEGVMPALPPGQLLRHLNGIVTPFTQSQAFITFYALLVPGDGVGDVVFASAGHQPALLMAAADAADPKPKRLMARGEPLGNRLDVEYQEKRHPIAAGDRIVLFTDGIIEAHDTKERTYGMRRMQSVLARCRKLSAAQAADALMADVTKHRGSVPAEDDMTLIIVDIPAAAATSDAAATTA